MVDFSTCETVEVMTVDDGVGPALGPVVLAPKWCGWTFLDMTDNIHGRKLIREPTQGSAL